VFINDEVQYLCVLARPCKTAHGQITAEPPDMDEVASWQSRNKLAFNLLRFGELRQAHDLAWPLTTAKVSLPTALFRGLLMLALERIRFDEHYYLQAYDDVVDALAKGLFRDAHHHYVEFGYFEDRLPYRIEVDSAFYLRSYPDVEEELTAGTLQSVQEHFEMCGYKEGRLPREGWSLLAG